MKVSPIPVLLAASLLLGGCGAVNVLSPYKIDVPQGNEVTADQVAQLKAGMSRGQVRFLLGTPLLTDPFHADRWDYVQSNAKGGRLLEQHAFTVFFEGDTLVRWQGSTLPADPNSRFSKAATQASAVAADSPAAEEPTVQPLVDEAKQ
ncbi:outer membrane protein assembly factor BamE [Chitinilyticum litopenaei]|uniref:outer membrane protein assembly factor BamE n=1 Tax=Chitinilyticum litopenaei TaxID=1121276 RepID=UPI0009DC3CAE|nr:outer membrane protein assembly factor BamE [Chitinilyticum litopenaei]